MSFYVVPSASIDAPKTSEVLSQVFPDPNSSIDRSLEIVVKVAAVHLPKQAQENLQIRTILVDPQKTDDPAASIPVKGSALPVYQIPDTKTRRIMHLVFAYNKCIEARYLETLRSLAPSDRQAFLKKEMLERIDYTKFPGIRVVDKIKEDDSLRNCSWYCFKDEPWHDQEWEHLIASPKPHEFLQAKGWETVEKPQIGDCIVYLSEKGRAVHFGVVHSIQKGQIYIRGLWGMKSTLVYEHSLSSVPTVYGASYSFVRKKPS